MIELNPFTKFTSACLFNWKHDIDILKVCYMRGKEGRDVVRGGML